MIRKYVTADCDSVLNVWLQASIIAHDFISRSFWESQQADMRNKYLVRSENYVFEHESKVIGFYALRGNTVAAIFVLPEFQGQGIGKALLNHAKRQRKHLDLAVFRENENGIAFYRSQGFRVVKEQVNAETGHSEYVMTTQPSPVDNS